MRVILKISKPGKDDLPARHTKKAERLGRVTGLGWWRCGAALTNSLNQLSVFIAKNPWQERER